MLDKPNINELMTRIDSKYKLVIVASRRARNMIDVDPSLQDQVGFHPISKAMEEVMNDTLHWSN